MTAKAEILLRIENDYSYHAPKNDQIPRYGELREHAKRMAYALAEYCPASREQSLAFTALEQVVMYANAAIARNE